MPPKKYPGTPITIRGAAPNPAKRTITDVVAAFDNIPLAGDYAPIESLKLLLKSKTYNPYKVEDFDRDANRKRHFQGIVRTQDGKHIIISGGDHRKKAAQLFICEVRTQGNSNRRELGVLPLLTKPVGKLMEIYFVDDKRFWHNGGISSFGNVLVLPLESDGFLPKQKFDTKESLIKFLDISNPKRPKDLQIDIKRPGTNAGAVSLVRLSTGYYLCSVWTDSDPDKGRTIDFYLSRSTNLRDGFLDVVKRYFYSKAHIGINPKYQGIKLILQDNDELYMMGTENSWALSPIPPGAGKNRARLYKIKYDLAHVTKKRFTSFNPSLDIIRGTNHKVFNKGKERYNFNGGAGIYLTPSNSLALYATHHRTFAQGKIISCTEFYPTFEKELINSRKDGVIELYENKEFGGRCLRIRGYNNTSFPDYKDVSVEADHFNDKVSSIRFQLPKGVTYLLYKNRSYQGSTIKLIGTGKLVEISNIHFKRKKNKTGVIVIPADMGDAVSSSKYLNGN